MQWQEFLLTTGSSQFKVRLWLNQRLKIDRIEKLQSLMERIFKDCNESFQAEIIVVKLHIHSSFSFQGVIYLIEKDNVCLFSGLNQSPYRVVKNTIFYMRKALKVASKIDEVLESGEQRPAPLAPMTMLIGRKL